MKTIKKKDKEPGLNRTEKFYILITLFLKEDIRKNLKPSDYPKERIAAKRLLDRYSDFEFFYSVPEYNNRYNSLLWLASNKMRPEIDNKFKEYLKNKENRREFVLEDKPVIEL